MKSVALSGNNRAEKGSSKSNILRKEEKVPCVIYGGKENIHFSVNEILFGKIVHSPEVYFIDLDIEGKKFKAIIKAVQYHPVTDRPIHVDFLEVNDNKALTVSIPVKLNGSSRGVLNGGKLRMVTRKLKISGLPNAIPEAIDIDITNLRIGQSIKVGEISVDGLSFLDASNAVVVAVKRSRVVAADEEEDEDGDGEEGAEGSAEGGEEAKTEEVTAE